MPLTKSILLELDREAQITQRVFDRVPEDKLGWKPHTKSQSLGQLAVHIATIPAFVAAAGAVDNFEIVRRTPPEVKSRQELQELFTKNLASVKALLESMDDAKLMANWTATMGGKVLMTMPRLGLIRTLLLNHSYHHRGQLSVYLRLLDVPVPSIYGPSADENPFQ